MTRKSKILLLIIAACVVIAVVIVIVTSTQRGAEKQEGISAAKEWASSVTPFNEQVENTRNNPAVPAKAEAIAQRAKQAAAEIKSKHDSAALEAESRLFMFYPDYYADNEQMESLLYYGYLLAYAFPDTERGMLGRDAVDAINYVYCEGGSPTDEMAALHLRQVENGLKLLGWIR